MVDLIIVRNFLFNMAYKHSPEQVAGQSFATKKRDWFPWNHTLLSSHSFGRVDPILCEPVTANTTIKLDMYSALQTNPTATPIFDNATITDSVFFVPQRIISRGIIGDNFMELGEIEDIEVPGFQNSPNTSVVGFTNDFYACLPGSLLNRLGVPAHIVAPCNAFIPLDSRHLTYDQKNADISSSAALNSLFSTPYINASPMIAYYMICERFYSNPYYPEVAVPHSLFSSDPDNLNVFGRLITTYFQYNLYDIRDRILQLRGIVSDSSSVSLPSANSIYTFDKHDHSGRLLGLDFGFKGNFSALITSYSYIKAGLFNNLDDMVNTLSNQMSSDGIYCAQFGKDYQTMFFDEEDISTLETDTSVELGTTITTQRIARTRFNKMFRSVLRGRKFTDWLDIQFGAKLKMSDHPIFCGSNSYSLMFNDVVNQSADNSENGTPLGTAASRGYASKSGSRPISFTTQEPGYIMILRTIVPNVSYNSVMPRWSRYRTMASFPLPAYSGSTFQDLRVDDLVTSFSDADGRVIGKQPLYFDYMQKFNRLQGVFATKLNESYTFKRENNLNSIPTENVAQQIGGTFILPTQFNYAFPSIGGIQQQENIFIKTAFKMSVLQPLDRSVLHTN